MRMFVVLGLCCLLAGSIGLVVPVRAETVRVLLKHNRFPAALEDVRVRFEAAYPGDSVAWVTSEAEDSDQHRGLVRNLMSNEDTGYDLFNIDVIWPGILGEFFDDLNEAGIAPGIVAELLPAAVGANTVDGRLVGVPVELDLGLLYYRHDLLARYGYPASVLPPRTWDELYAMASDVQAKMREEDPVGNANVWGFDTQLVENEGLTCIALESIYTNGGGEIIEDTSVVNGTSTSTVTVDNPRAHAGLQRLHDWVGDIIDPTALTQRAGGSADRFRRGGSVFMRNWAFAIGTSKQPYSECEPDEQDLTGLFSVAPMPADVPERQAGTLGGWQLSLSRYSTRKATSIRLLNFLFSVEAQEILASYGFPITRMERYFPGSTACNTTGLCQNFKTVARFSSFPNYLERSADFQKAVTKVLTGELTAAASLSQLAGAWTYVPPAPQVTSSSGPGALIGGIVGGVAVLLCIVAGVVYRHHSTRRVRVFVATTATTGFPLSHPHHCSSAVCPAAALPCAVRLRCAVLRSLCPRSCLPFFLEPASPCGARLSNCVDCVYAAVVTTATRRHGRDPGAERGHDFASAAVGD